MRRRAHQARLAAERAEELLLAVNEIATNSLTHTGRGGTLRIWQAHGALVCEVHDSGHIPDPLAGRHIPTPHALHGRGLWIVNQLCDLVEIRSDGDGTTVRMHVRRES